MVDLGGGWVGRVEVLLVVGGVVLVGVVALVWWAARAVANDERKLGISWWGARNGWRYSRGTDHLLGYFEGAPFDRGISRDVQDVLSGHYRERPALIVQFSWYHSPDAEQSQSTATSGVQAGTAVAAVIELPGQVPELTVRRESLADQVLGDDLDTESGRFNEIFRVVGEQQQFAHAVVNPRMMELLLDDPRSERFSLRLDGPMLVVWYEGKLKHGTEVGDLMDFAGRVLDLVPNFVYTKYWGPNRGRTRTPVGRIPAEALGEVPMGSIHALRRVTHRGHELELYEHRPVTWGKQTWSVVMKIPVPTALWPKLELVPRATGPQNVDRLTIEDEFSTGDEDFDRLFLIGCPEPDFARMVLTPDLIQWLLADPRGVRSRIIWESEGLTPADDGVPEPIDRAVLSIAANGRLTDEALLTKLLDHACDVHAQLPPNLLTYRQPS